MCQHILIPAASVESQNFYLALGCLGPELSSPQTPRIIDFQKTVTTLSNTGDKYLVSSKYLFEYVIAKEFTPILTHFHGQKLLLYTRRECFIFYPLALILPHQVMKTASHPA